MVFDRPQVPVVHHSAREQNAHATDQRTQHGEPPSPTVDGLHRGIEAHGPAPEQASTFRGRSTVNNLFNLALSAITGHRQNGGTVHGKQQH